MAQCVGRGAVHRRPDRRGPRVARKSAAQLARSMNPAPMWHHLSWTLRNSSGVSEGIHHSVVQSGGEFLYIGVAG